jgi:hypothetical protein
VANALLRDLAGAIDNSHSTDATHSTDSTEGTPMSQTTPLTDAARTEILNQAVAGYARDGWTVNSVAGFQAVLSRKKRIGWFWNLILALVTGGLWLIVVIIRVVNRKILTAVLSVDAYGRVSERR